MSSAYLRLLIFLPAILISACASSFVISSVTQSCPTLCDPMDCSTPGLPVHHQLPEFIQTHVHWDGDTIQPSHLCHPLLHCLHCDIFINKTLYYVFFSSVQSLSHVWLFATPWTAAREASLSITNSQDYSSSCPLSWWCHPTISSSVVPFSTCPQSFPASGSFQMSQFFVYLSIIDFLIYVYTNFLWRCFVSYS